MICNWQVLKGVFMTSRRRVHAQIALKPVSRLPKQHAFTHEAASFVWRTKNKLKKRQKIFCLTFPFIEILFIFTFLLVIKILIRTTARLHHKIFSTFYCFLFRLNFLPLHRDVSFFSRQLNRRNSSIFIFPLVFFWFFLMLLWIIIFMVDEEWKGILRWMRQDFSFTSMFWKTANLRCFCV